MNRDQVYKNKKSEILPFCFNEEVAHAFDDMISRSIPFYHEIHKIIADIIESRKNKPMKVYDLGCSTANTLIFLNQILPKECSLIGVDSSASMIKEAKAKLEKLDNKNIELIHDSVQSVPLNGSDLTIMNYTLQFVEPNERSTILKAIYEGLNPNGVFILTEKVKSNASSIENLTTDIYYEFKKRNGYSELEILQKREALKDVMKPTDCHSQLRELNNAGFSQVDLIFKWYNFACYIGIK